MIQRLKSRVYASESNSRLGMSLVEIMFASGIMGLTLVFLAGSVINMRNTRILTGEKSIVRARLSTITDELQRANTDELLTYVAPDFEEAPTLSELNITYVLNGDAGTLEPPVDLESLAPDFELELPMEIQINMVVNSITGRPLSVDRVMLVGDNP